MINSLIKSFFILAIYSLSITVEAASSFWCFGVSSYGNRFWLDVDYSNSNTAEITLTNEDYSPSTGEITYPKSSYGPVHCEKLGFGKITCIDNQGRLRLQDYPPNSYHLNLSEDGDERNEYSVQIISCSSK